MKNALPFLTTLALALLTGACSTGDTGPAASPPSSSPPSSPPPPSPPIPKLTITGLPRELRRMTGGGVDVLLPAGAPVTIRFDKGGHVSGHSGVNSFHGGYRREGAVLTWTGPFASTRRGGSPEDMAFETRFLQVLEACVKAEETADGGLRLSGAAGELVFGPGVPPSPAP